MSTRRHDVRDSRYCLIGQRTHEQDLIGHVLERESGLWTVINLPMRYEVGVARVRVAGWSPKREDPRRAEGELLWAERFPEEEVKALERSLGPYAVAAQLQQRPSPRKGGMFPKEAWGEPVGVVQWGRVRKVVRYWDKAETEGGGKFSYGVLMFQLSFGSGKDQLETYLVYDVVRGQWSSRQREDIIHRTAVLDSELLSDIREQYPQLPELEIWEEQEPGSGGKESAELTIARLAGFAVFAEPPKGDKETRARAYAAQQQGHNVSLFRAAWNTAFIHEHAFFPNGAFVDQVDAAAGAFRKLVLQQGKVGGSMRPHRSRGAAAIRRNR
jgi:predicted phage terminase large subunit-like protein